MNEDRQRPPLKLKTITHSSPPEASYTNSLHTQFKGYTAVSSVSATLSSGRIQIQGDFALRVWFTVQLCPEGLILSLFVFTVCFFSLTVPYFSPSILPSLSFIFPSTSCFFFLFNVTYFSLYISLEDKAFLHCISCFITFSVRSSLYSQLNCFPFPSIYNFRHLSFEGLIYSLYIPSIQPLCWYLYIPQDIIFVSIYYTSLVLICSHFVRLIFHSFTLGDGTIHQFISPIIQ